jgi:hypothetical protein
VSGQTIAALTAKTTHTSEANATRRRCLWERAASENDCRCLKIGTEGNDQANLAGGKDLDAETKKPACGIAPADRLFLSFDCAAAKRSRWEKRGDLGVLLH